MGARATAITRASAWPGGSRRDSRGRSRALSRRSARRRVLPPRLRATGRLRKTKADRIGSRTKTFTRTRTSAGTPRRSGSRRSEAPPRTLWGGEGRVTNGWWVMCFPFVCFGRVVFAPADRPPHRSNLYIIEIKFLEKKKKKKKKKS